MYKIHSIQVINQRLTDEFPRDFRDALCTQTKDFADLDRHLAPNGPMPIVIITMCLLNSNNSVTKTPKWVAKCLRWNGFVRRSRKALRTLAACASYQCRTGEHYKVCVPRQESRSRALAPNTYIFTTAQRLLWKCTCISTPGSIGARGWQEQLPGIELTGEWGSNGM